MRYIKNENVDDIPNLVHIIYIMLAIGHYGLISVSTRLAHFYPLSDSWCYPFSFTASGKGYSVIPI